VQLALNRDAEVVKVEIVQVVVKKGFRCKDHENCWSRNKGKKDQQFLANESKKQERGEGGSMDSDIAKGIIDLELYRGLASIDETYDYRKE